MAANVFKKIVAGGSKKSTVEWIIVIVLVILVATILAQIYKALKGGSAVIGKQLGDAANADRLGLPQERVSYIQDKANSLWNDSSGNTWFYLWLRAIDKEAFIKTINSMNNTIELGWLDEAYKQASGINLIQSMTGSFYPFNATEKARLKQGYYSFLTR